MRNSLHSLEKEFHRKIHLSEVQLKFCLTPPMNESEKSETAAILIQKPCDKQVIVCSITYLCL